MFVVRRYRLTGSRFGDVISCKPTTPFLNILQPTNFTSVAIKYRIDNEKLALKALATQLVLHRYGNFGIFR